ncbi:MAG: hypothetical protein ACI80L_001165 [Pseudohongiellaceae bacterium]|jgi:hypothetical protein
MEPNSFIQDYTALAEASMMAATVYLSVLTAYLFTAYSVGAKLSLFQYIFVSALFVAFGSVFAFGTWGLMNAATNLYASTSDFGNSGGLQPYLASIVVFCEAAGIIGALMFASDIRRKNEL